MCQDNLFQYSIKQSDLSKIQNEKYHKLTNRKYFGDHYIVKINSLHKIQVNGRLKINLPDMACHPVFKAETIEFNNNKNFFWAGSSLIGKDNCDESDGNLFLLKKDGIFIGSLSIGDDDYSIEHLGNNIYLIAQSFIANGETLICGIDDKLQNRKKGIHSTSQRNNNCPIRYILS